MSHDIVFFKNSLLGNVFGKIPKSKTSETIDFTAFPEFFLEIFQKWDSQKWFWENEKSVFGRNPDFWETFLGNLCFWGCWKIATKDRRCALMRKMGFKGRCTKKALSKSKEICRTYDPIQGKYAEKLEESPEIQEIRCNVLMEGLEEGEYTSDFVCIKTNGDLMVRECLQRDRLTKPMNVKLLNASRNYWLKRGADWGLVVDAEV